MRSTPARCGSRKPESDVTKICKSNPEIVVLTDVGQKMRGDTFIRSHSTLNASEDGAEVTHAVYGHVVAIGPGDVPGADQRNEDLGTASGRPISMLEKDTKPVSHHAVTKQGGFVPTRSGKSSGVASFRPEGPIENPGARLESREVHPSDRVRRERAVVAAHESQPGEARLGVDPTPARKIRKITFPA